MTTPKQWDGKRYHSLDYALKKRFGEKVYKVSLNGGMTCPNRDGTLDTRGCIFCSRGGSGDFAAPLQKNVTKQIDSAILGIKKRKSTGNKYIAYFQAFTNTYAPVDYLYPLFLEAISHPSIVALSIATRPDCLGDDILSMLDELNNIKPVWIELGLQTSNEQTAHFIRRGYPLSTFERAVCELRQRSIEIIVHVIIGLPFETREDLLHTILYLANQPIQGIKLQLLHILRGTDLADYLSTIAILSLEEYVEQVILCLEHLPSNLIIHRITGDGPKELLLAPLWSSKKRVVMNTIHQHLLQKNTWQGKLID